MKGHGNERLPTQTVGQSPLRGARILLEIDPPHGRAVEQQPPGQPFAGAKTNLAHHILRYPTGHLHLQVLAEPVQQAENGHIRIEEGHGLIDH